MRSLRLSILALAAALAGCSSLKINTEYDPTAPLATYKSYAWLPNPPGPEQAAAMRNPQVHALVLQAIDREMARKGFVRTSADANPDFLVSVIGWSQSRIEVTSYGYGYGSAYAYGPYGPSMAVAMPVASAQQYTDGTLLLDFIDPKTMKLVWRGTATDTIASPDQVVKTIDTAARELVAAFPPPK